jgi:hypothetical protein
MKKNEIITFDFDDTLFSLAEEKVGSLWTASDVLAPIQQIHDILFQKHSEGYAIGVVTARELWNFPQVEEYIKDHKLPVTHIRCSDGGSKLNILKELDTTLHIDDLLSVVEEASAAGISCILVDDGRHTHNTEAHKFERIFVNNR